MKQITIITPPDRPGTLADIAECLGARGVNIVDIDATDDHAHGVILLQAEPYDEALRALADGGFHAMSEEVLVIRVKDEPGALAKVAARFREPGINIRAMRILRRDAGWTSVIVATDDNERARRLLTDCLVRCD
ncbi:MAG: ACT domain-containing protein [Verrucomicrobia bacterium]|jgi:hypothetical protein|nr:ACT domain-containing protein [Verrucomicrobiota bacterium]